MVKLLVLLAIMALELHFSILANGTNYIDPAPWLAARGIKLGPYAG